jgi:D-lactate dehydrogenase
VYFPTCPGRLMGGLPHGDHAGAALLRVAARAGVQVHLPPQVGGLCCGQAFSSKGFSEAYQLKINELVEKLWALTHQGEYPVVLDLTSCTHTLLQGRPHLSPPNQAKWDQLRILDSIDFAADWLLPRLAITPKERIVFHPVCSVHKMGLLKKLEAIGQACAREAVFPAAAGCCGMAGDRGFYHPGLTQAATAAEAAEVRQSEYQGYYSSARTCEMALTEAVGHPYESLLRLLDEVSQPLSN